MKFCRHCKFRFSDHMIECTACGGGLRDMLLLAAPGSAATGRVIPFRSGAKNLAALQTKENPDHLSQHENEPPPPPPDSFPGAKGPEQKPPPQLVVDPWQVDFGTLSKVGGGSRSSSIRNVTIRIDEQGKLNGTVTATTPWVQISPNEFYLDSSNPRQEIEIKATSRGLSPGPINGHLVFSTGSGTKKIPYYMRVTQPWIARHQKPVIFYAAVIQGLVGLVYFFPTNLDLKHPLGMNKPPILKSIEASPKVVVRGERIKLIAVATDPEGDDITYQWKPEDGKIEYDNDKHEIVWLNTWDIKVESRPLSIEVKLSISDGRDGTMISDKKIVTIEPPPTNASPPVKASDNNDAGIAQTPEYARRPAPVQKPARALRQPALDAYLKSREAEPYIRATQLREKGDFFQALEICKQFLGTDPGNALFQKLKRDLEADVLRKFQAAELEKKNSQKSPPTEGKTGQQPEPSSGQSAGETVSVRINRPVYPIFPIEARQGGFYGEIVVEVLIDENGKVIQAKIIKDEARHPLLRQAAIEAARRSTFFPALLNGRPIKGTWKIPYNFSR